MTLQAKNLFERRIYKSRKCFIVLVLFPLYQHWFEWLKVQVSTSSPRAIAAAARRDGRTLVSNHYAYTVYQVGPLLIHYAKDIRRN